MRGYKNILITGAAGFIGSHTAEKFLQRGCNVIGFDNFDSFYPREIKERNLKTALAVKNFSFIEGDITKISDLEKLPAEIDLVIHLAAKAGVRPSIENPSAYINTNINGTQNILEWMRKRKISKMIFASSSSVYGNNLKVPFSETDNVDFPISPYAFTKKACELINHNYHHLYNIDIINLRFFTVYGERQRPDLAIHKFTKNIFEGKPIPMFGDGSTARDYTYIADIVNGIAASYDYLISHNDVFEIINLGNSSPVDLKTLIEKIYTATGATTQIEKLPKQAGDVERTFADISKANFFLNYEPRTTLDEGLKKFAEWFKSEWRQPQ